MDQWWLRLVLLVGPTIVALVMMTQVSSIGLDLTKGEDWLIILSCVIPFIVTVFLWRMSLRTEIEESEIRLRFWPIARQVIKVSDIQDVSVVTYNPLRDYGGWGVRWSSKGKAWNAKGNQGVKLSLKNGKVILIGSQKSDELYEHITAEMKNYEST